MTKKELQTENQILKERLKQAHDALITETEQDEYTCGHDYPCRVGKAIGFIECVEDINKINLGLSPRN